MKHTYSFALQSVARIVLACLFFQNCSYLAISPIGTTEGDKSWSKQLDIQAIVGKEFVAAGNHLVTFYEEAHTLHANVHVNPLDEVDKLYKEIPVMVEQGVNVRELPSLDKKAQQKRIQVQFSDAGKPTSVVIHKPWLMGGGNDEIIMFCGNPGVGKSALCNSVFQQVVFKSGANYGKGLTTQKQEYSYENKLYIDTPGLDDVEHRQQAAAEIEEALKQNDNYKVVFVATLESGRIRPSDLITINTVCESIQTNFDYGLIFNKVTDPVIQKINEEGSGNYLTSLNKIPSAIVILKNDSDMEDMDDKYFQANHENRDALINFLNSLHASKIKDSNINKIEIKDSEEKIEEEEKKYKIAMVEQEFWYKKEKEEQETQEKREKEEQEAREKKEIEEQEEEVKKEKEKQQAAEEQERAHQAQVEEANRKVERLEQERRERERKNESSILLGTTLGIMGGAIGALGGPVGVAFGATAGAKIGGEIGQQIG